MAKMLIDQVLARGREIVADRRKRAREYEAVTALGVECDPCDDSAARYCAVGALIRAAYELTGEHERAHALGWEIAALIDSAAGLQNGGEGGYGVTRVNDMRGQAAVLRAFDRLAAVRR